MLQQFRVPISRTGLSLATAALQFFQLGFLLRDQRVEASGSALL